MASFVEQATLLVNDKSSSKIRAINAELKKLFATMRQMQGKKTTLGLDTSKLATARKQIQGLGRDLRKMQSSPVKVTMNTRQAMQALNALRTSAARPINLRYNLTGGRQGAGMGGNVPPPNNMFWGRRQDNNWQAAGRIIGRAFVASIGGTLYAKFGQAARSAGRGVLSLDDAQTAARAQGVDPVTLEAASRKAADSTRGVSVADIMDASLEQAGVLQQRLSKGLITQQEYAKGVERVTQQIAEASQIYGSATGDFAKANEMARKEQKILANAQLFAPEERESMAKSLRRAFLATGGDVDPDEILRKQQQLGSIVAQSTTEKGYAALILAVDEQGAAAAAEFRTAFRDLTRGDLAKKDVKAQQAQGLRDASGKSVFTQEQLGDPIALAANELIPRLQKLGVNLDSVTDVAAALDMQLGFSTKGAQFFSGLISNYEQRKLEIDRAQSTNPEVYLQTPTLRAQLAEITSTWQDEMSKSLKDFMPLMKGAASGVSGLIKGIGDSGIPGAPVLAGGLTFATAASLEGMSDPASRPLSAAALALTGSAVALDGAAAALAGAAVFGGVGGKLGFKGNIAKYGLLGIGMYLDEVAGEATPMTAEGRSAKFAELTNEAEKKRAALLERQKLLTEQIARTQRGVKSPIPGAMDEMTRQMQVELDGVQMELKSVGVELVNLGAGAQKAQVALGTFRDRWAETIASLGQSQFKIRSSDEFKRAFPKIGSAKGFEAQNAAMDKDAIRKLQETIGAKVDGIFGPQTQALLDEYKKQRADLAQAEEAYRAGLALVTENADRNRILNDPMSAVNRTKDDFAGPGVDPTQTDSIGAAIEAATAGFESAGQTVGTAITGAFGTGGTGAGASIAGAMLGVAPSIGNTIAALMSAAAANVKVNVAQTPVVNTGGGHPVE